MSWLVVFICSPLAALSVVLIVLGIQDLRGSLSCTRLPVWLPILAQGLAGLFWTLVLPLSAYLVSQQVLPMIVFLVFSAVALVGHWALLCLYIRAYVRDRANEQPRQQLLIRRKHKEDELKVDVEAPNPFRPPSLGIIPGTSSLGYILWLPNGNDGGAGSGGPTRATPVAGASGAAAGGLASPPWGQSPQPYHRGEGGAVPHAGRRSTDEREYLPAPSPTDAAGGRDKEGKARLVTVIKSMPQ